jgi:hypothetical protein
MGGVNEVRMAVTDTETRMANSAVWLSPGQDAIVSRVERHRGYHVFQLRFQRGSDCCCKRVRGVWVA